jgi:hypothetical protein
VEKEEIRMRGEREKREGEMREWEGEERREKEE